MSGLRRALVVISAGRYLMIVVNLGESQIGRRLKLRDLYVFLTVVKHRSMAKAAKHLGVSQPAVSEVIADLEEALAVRLLDRSARGVEPTIYGGALLKRSVAAFDELKQGIRDIEFLSDPTAGEVRIAAPVPFAAFDAAVIDKLTRRHPRVVSHLTVDGTAPATMWSSLRRRHRAAACRSDCRTGPCESGCGAEAAIADLRLVAPFLSGHAAPASR